jgi:transcriptional regulator with XRE-family HTH domain
MRAPTPRLDRPSMLRMRRLARGWRLRDLRDVVGIDEATLGGVERGDLPLRGRVLHKLAEVYATSGDRLLYEHARWERTRRSVIVGARDEARLLSEVPEGES